MKHPPSPSPPYWFWFAAVAGLALLASLTIAARHSAVADDHASWPAGGLHAVAGLAPLALPAIPGIESASNGGKTQ